MAQFRVQVGVPSELDLLGGRGRRDGPSGESRSDGSQSGDAGEILGNPGAHRSRQQLQRRSCPRGVPPIASHNVQRSEKCGEHRAQHGKQPSLRPQLPLRHIGLIEHVERGSVLGLLNFGDLVLLGQGLEDRLLDLHVAIKIGVFDGQQGQLANRRKAVTIMAVADAHPGELAAQLVGLGGRGAHARVVGSIDLAQPGQLGFGSDSLPAQRSRGGHHGLALFGKIDGGVSAGKFAERAEVAVQFAA